MLAPEAALPTASSPGLPRTKDTGQKASGTPRLAYSHSDAMGGKSLALIKPHPKHLNEMKNKMFALAMLKHVWTAHI